MFGKIVQRLVDPAASFFGDIGSGFDGDIALLGKVVDGGDDQSALLEEFSFFLIVPPFDTPLSLQSLCMVATSKSILYSKLSPSYAWDSKVRDSKSVPSQSSPYYPQKSGYTLPFSDSRVRQDLVYLHVRASKMTGGYLKK